MTKNRLTILALLASFAISAPLTAYAQTATDPAATTVTTTAEDDDDGFDLGWLGLIGLLGLAGLAKRRDHTRVVGTTGTTTGSSSTIR
jgi:MYXO-CTERM domain-containing protein